MKKVKLLKKVLVLGLAVAMLMGTTTNLLAIEDPVESTETIILEGYGVATCSLLCDYGKGMAEAETKVDADMYSYYVYSYTELEVELLRGDGVVEFWASEDNGAAADIANGFYSITSKVEITEDAPYNISLYANSYHLAEIDEVSDSCYLTAEDLE